MFDQAAFEALCSGKSPTTVFAQTLWGEARGEGLVGMNAVACVIMNRAKAPERWAHGVVGVIAVCLSPWQFSCWNVGDPNRAKMLAITSADPSYRTALQVAGNALIGPLTDITSGADSYFAIGTPVPSWALTGRRTRDIGHHAFYIVASQSAPAISVHTAPELTADQLMAQEEEQLGIAGETNG